MTDAKWLAGYHAVEESIASGEGRGEILYSRRSLRIDSIIKSAAENGILSRKASRDELDKIAGSENHRGLLYVYTGIRSEKIIEKKENGKAVTEKFKTLEDFLENLPEKENLLVLVLDGVTDPQNLGAILRSADMFDVDLVLHPERGSAGLNATVRNVSAGAAAWVSLVPVTNLARTLSALKDNGFWIYGAEMNGEQAHKINLKGRTALVMGSEGKGLRRLVAEGCDGFISIPTGGHIDSLNVSVAAGILLYEARRQIL